MSYAELLKRRLEVIHGWYRGMVNPDTRRLEYLYIPQADSFVRERSPIRDIASIWDLELLERFLDRDDLRPVIETSLQHYSGYLVDRDGDQILDPQRLGEPSSIAHSAFMLLALLHAPPTRHAAFLPLAEGILRQQRPNGSYQVYFHDLPDEGEELYAGEAMLALLETYRQVRVPRYLHSVERAFAYYDAHYFQSGRVGEDLLVFFANWQSQACRLLFEHTESVSIKQAAAGYVFRLHDRIMEQGFYEDIERHPARQLSVEVACALEGLNEAYTLASAASKGRAEHYRQGLCTGLGYLLELQGGEGGSERERGGFGMSLEERAQRIDVTGHVASAFMKSIENGFACP